MIEEFSLFSPIFQKDLIRPNYIDYYSFSGKDYLAIGFYDPFNTKREAFKISFEVKELNGSELFELTATKLY